MFEGETALKKLKTEMWTEIKRCLKAWQRATPSTWIQRLNT